MTNSEKIKRLIFLAYIASGEPTQLADDGTVILSWNDAMSLYKETVQDETIHAVLQIVDELKDEREQDDVSESDTAETEGGDVTPEVQAEAIRIAQEWSKQEDPGDLPEPQEEDAPANDSEGETPEPVADPTPAPFRGCGAGEKQQIYARLLAFCRSVHGASGKLAKATNGVLSPEDIIGMRNAGKYTMPQWRAVNAAMDWVEQHRMN